MFSTERQKAEEMVVVSGKERRNLKSIRAEKREKIKQEVHLDRWPAPWPYLNLSHEFKGTLSSTEMQFFLAAGKSWI